MKAMRATMRYTRHIDVATCSPSSARAHECHAHDADDMAMPPRVAGPEAVMRDLLAPPGARLREQRPVGRSRIFLSASIPPESPDEYAFYIFEISFHADAATADIELLS